MLILFIPFEHTIIINKLVYFIEVTSSQWYRISCLAARWLELQWHIVQWWLFVNHINKVTYKSEYKICTKVLQAAWWDSPACIHTSTTSGTSQWEHVRRKFFIFVNFFRTSFYTQKSGWFVQRCTKCFNIFGFFLQPHCNPFFFR